MEIIVEELGIPKKYLRNTDREDRFIACVHRSWLKSLVKYSKLEEFTEKCHKQDVWSNNEESCPFWEQIFVRVFKKWDIKVLPLPRIRKLECLNSPLFLAQLLQYISQVNHKNSVKNAQKKYSNEDRTNKEKPITLVNYNEALKDCILRIYGCPIVNICDISLSSETSTDFEVHKNILPSVCCIETLNSIFLLHVPYLDFTLNDCLNFSPAILEKCYTKPLFIVYQLLQAFRTLHDRSLTIGNVSLNDIYLTENLWIYIIPDITSNLHVQNIENERENDHDCSRNGHRLDNQLKCDYCGVCTYDRVHIRSENLENLCQLWMRGDISNFTYITSLNNLSGRKIGDPNCHHVFPWVTDFASRCGKNWRDLKKSKYRLNKGDRQLDLTYEGTQTQISHHVSDVLSSITYFVYMARRTPRSVLCKNVRTIWVPAEYPSSIQRMQEWTPDECIPEFFTDPSIFRSIHDDLDDLEVPPWCSGPEDFIERHRSALEGQHVSERLHHWIDLTFGFKLSGNAAIKAKNVCLHLADEHTYLTKSGIVQLFNHPHPCRHSSTLIFYAIPNRLGTHKGSRQRNRDRSHSIGVETSRTEEEETAEDSSVTYSSRSSLGFSRYLSQSRTSLYEEVDYKSSRSPSRSASVGPKSSSFTSHVSSRSKHQPNILRSDTIQLPKEFKPDLAIDLLEKRHSFFSKTFHSELSKSTIFPQEDEKCITSDQLIVQNSFTNFIFSEPFELNNSKIGLDRNNKLYQSRNTFYPYVKPRAPAKKSDCYIFCDYSGLISKCRIRELQVLGCLIVEIFSSRKLQAFSFNKANLKFSERLKACITILRTCTAEFPTCIKYIATLLLQPETIDFSKFSYPVITEFGLPPPSAHILLEPSLHINIPFSKHFRRLYQLLSILKDFENISNEMNILYHFECDGSLCSEFENLETTKVLFIQNIAECKVKTCTKLTEMIFEELNTTTDVAIVDIMLPHIKELLDDPPTSVLTAWYLFDPFSKIMGPKKTTRTLLESVLKLYENELTESTIPYHGRIAKLYHHSFMLRLMVRLGLKCFLDNFITPIVEAVGGYKDYEKVDFILHSHYEKILKKTSHLKTMDTEQGETSPSDDSSFSSGGKANISPKKMEVAKEPEIFDFEEEKPDEKQSLIEHLELNASSDLPLNNSSAEEALDASLAENIDHLRNLEELKINIYEDYDDKLLMSPITFLPTSQHYEFNNISCEIGNKRAENEDMCEKKSTDTEDNTGDDPDYSDTKQNFFSSKNNKRSQCETRISDMSADSLIWLSHRLGPVLTARYLSRNLLKMLTLCYVGRDNLVPVPYDHEFHNDIVSITSSNVVGDGNAVKVLECLVHIAGLYGEQFILFQYIPHMSELIALFKRKISLNLEGGLISCLALLKHVIPYLSDSTLMDQLQDNILKNVIHPAVRLLGSTKYTFPSGFTARSTLANKYIDAMYVLSIRIGSDMTRSHLAVPALQRFFSIFDKLDRNESRSFAEEVKNSPDEQSKDSNIVELNRDGSIREWNISTARPIQITHVRLKDSESMDSLSPPKPSSQPDVSREENRRDTAFQELQSVFTPELAHTAYMPFLKHLGVSSLEISLSNHEHIKDLCKEYTTEMKTTLTKEIPVQHTDQNKTSIMVHSGSIGSNVAVIGNRIEVQSETDETSNSDLLNLVSNKIENNNRHLRGNWLAYWGHEIGRADKDNMFNFKQIKLQTFNGHSNSVKCLYVLDNENSFMSGSRDKTVKLWSLRSQGDGSSFSNCQWTYTAHKKSVLSITFIESMRLVASCDSVIHIWDPFMGVNIGVLEASKYAPVNTLKTMPAPSCLVYAATTEGSLKLIDTRLCSYIFELKVSVNPPGLIRCLAISPTGMWVAAGQSSGNIAVLDTRTGLIISSWRAHENEVLQLVAVDNNTLISSSLDQNISVWSVCDGKFKFHMRGSAEPVHCLNIYNTELISGSTANRIGVHTSIDADSNFSSTKLRSDAFKGLLTSMVLLPLNRLLLLGADTGTINLLC